MKIYAFPLGQLGTNAYVVHKDGSDKAVLIDAPMDAAEVIPQFLKENKLKLEAILLTHGHWDHVWDAAKLAKKMKVKLYASAEGKDLIEKPEFQKNHMFAGTIFEAAAIDVFPKDGDILKIADMEIECRDAPGHCPGSLVYYIKDADGGALFAGDVIFQDSIGRTDLWGGSYPMLEKSIREKVYTLPDDTVILPGHGESTSVGHEKRCNPFVRA